jgi:DNA-binding transcriptional MerR regulator
MLRRVAFIRASQRVGLPLATIRQALDQLGDSRTPTRSDWARLSAAWRDDLDDHLGNDGPAPETSGASPPYFGSAADWSGLWCLM